MVMKQRVFEYELPFDVELQKDGGYVAKCPTWSDCYAQGDTFDDAVLEITAVAQSLIELYREEELTIPLTLLQEKSSDNSLIIPIFVTS